MTRLRNTVNNELKFPVCEKFVSINGEGRRAGQLAVFVRFRGCNLRCSYCDTAWANDGSAPAELLTAEEICGYVRSTGVKNVTLTGGEPLLRPGIGGLMAALNDLGLSIEVETNGAVALDGFCASGVRPDCFTMDYKLPSSGMEDRMIGGNFDLLGSGDCVKFVSGSEEDLNRAFEVINERGLVGRCGVYISPVFGAIEPRRIVEFMEERGMNGVNLQIQLHKVIWEPDRRGV